MTTSAESRDARRLVAGGGRKVWRPGLQSSRPDGDTEREQLRMDRDSLTLQINNMRFQAKMERWPLLKSIEE